MTAPARRCATPGCDCDMSCHNWGTQGYPRIVSMAEHLSRTCDRCGHPLEPTAAPPEG